VSSGLEAQAYQADGTPRPRAVKLPVDPFDGRVHEAAMHQAVKVYMANQRQGTAQTKTRGLVSGGNTKPWRQKGTGRARQGSIRSPLWPGGGTMFGPHPREYRLAIPKKLRGLARRSALNARAQERSLAVIAPLAFEEPKTKRMAELIAKMGLDGHKVLVLTSELKVNVVLSARNIPLVDVMRYSDASTYDILHADSVVIEEPALGSLESGAEMQHEPRPKKKAKAARRPDAEAEPVTAHPAKRKAAKPAARKAPAVAAKKTDKPKAAAKAAKPKASAKKPAAKKPGKKKD
jgi:large subunit ribosomal protein L4